MRVAQGRRASVIWLRSTSEKDIRQVQTPFSSPDKAALKQRSLQGTDFFQIDHDFFIKSCKLRSSNILLLFFSQILFDWNIILALYLACYTYVKLDGYFFTALIHP